MMLGKIVKITYFIFCLVIVLYLAIPNFSFPLPPPDSIASTEPADLETPLRRSYFTNYSRKEVLDWYKKQFGPSLLLNYPPEMSQTIIREQTSSTFLQELVHKIKESVYINGYEPVSKDNVPNFSIGGASFRQKIIIFYNPSPIWVRELLFIGSAITIVIVYNAYVKLIIKKDE